MTPNKPEDWKPASIDALTVQLGEAIENGEFDDAFKAENLTPGALSRAKGVRNPTKDYLRAYLLAGESGFKQANYDTALGLVNAYMNITGRDSFAVLPPDYYVISARVPNSEGEIKGVEIFIKKGNVVLYSERIDLNSESPSILSQNLLNTLNEASFVKGAQTSRPKNPDDYKPK